MHFSLFSLLLNIQVLLRFPYPMKLVIYKLVIIKAESATYSYVLLRK